jgi:hypothetical protein
MTDELSELRRQIATLQRRLEEIERRQEGSSIPRPEASRADGDDRAVVQRRPARRDLLRHLPVAAVGVVAAGTVLAQPASAADGAPVYQGRSNTGSKTTTIRTTSNTSAAPSTALAVTGGLDVDTIDAFTVSALTLSAQGLGSEGLVVTAGGDGSGGTVVASRFIGDVDGRYGNVGGSPVIVVDGVTGPLVDIDLKDGIAGNETGDPHKTPGTGIRVRGQHLATGIDIEVGSGAPALQAKQTDAASTSPVINVTNVGTGRTVYAESSSTTSRNAVITGTANGPGSGVWGQHNGPTGQGITGVSTHGAGGRFQGGAANLRLVPSTASTHPTSGVAGDLFVDKSGRLWYCTKGSSGSAAAKWKQLA